MRIEKNSLQYLLLVLQLILGCTQAAGPATLFPYQARAWNKTPTIVVLGQEGDSRNQFVKDAVEFWNGLLTQIGSGFTLGPVRFVSTDVERRADKLSVLIHSNLLRGLRTPTGRLQSSADAANLAHTLRKT